MKTDINILATEKLKEWNYTVPGRRVCDKPTRNEGCLSLSRRVDFNYKRQVREWSESPYKHRRLRTRIDGNKSQRYRAAFSMLTSEALPIIGIPPVPTGVVRSIGTGVPRCRLTALRRKHGRPLPLLPLLHCKRRMTMK